MAKKKYFGDLVESSFNEGYVSDPKVETKTPEKEPQINFSHTPTENEILLRKLIAGNEATINDLLNHAERSTYYLTELQRACIEVKAREDFTTKQEVVRTALEKYFDEKTVAAAREEIIRKQIKMLERKISEESKE